MTTPQTDDPALQTAIVVHPPLSGDPERIERLPEEIRTGDALRSPQVAVALPAGIRDPYAHRAALAESAARTHVRVYGLDAVRGLCLLAMNLTFALPTPLLLPAWMYHRQLPPPGGQYVPLAGLTWQDIIFPGFLFAMAAAIPIRGNQLIASGEPTPAIIWGALQRTALLYVFALVIGHVNPYYTRDFTQTGNVIAIVGFVTCFALFIRAPRSWSPRVVSALRRAAWAGVAIILFVLPLVWGATFSPTRRDTIITAIAFVYFLGSVIWVLTRHRPAWRVVIMVVLLLLKAMAPVVDPVAVFLGRSALPWIYEPWFFELLLIALPGTIAGDLIVQWTRASGDVHALRDDGRSRGRMLGIAALGFLVPVVLLAGLYERNLVPTTGAVIAIVAVSGYLLTRDGSDRGRVLARLGGLTGALLVAGILLEPLEGGIKKDPQTMSFLLVCAGLWLSVLLAATVMIDGVGGIVRRIAQPIVLVGQNAMLAYVIFMLFFMHIAYILGFGNMLSATPAQQAMRGALATTLVLAALWAATRKGIVWRS